jgi:ligand-binding SRPBCC domain-containing protein
VCGPPPDRNASRAAADGLKVSFRLADMSTIHLQTRMSAPIEVCFDLERNVEAHCRSVGHTHERAVAGTTTGYLGLGDTVTWEAVHFGLRLRLSVVITEYERPYRFVDELLCGPFKRLKHVHEFAATPDGTLMTDVFHYELPFGLLGLMADKLFVQRYLRRLLCMRNAALKRMTETPS